MSLIKDIYRNKKLLLASIKSLLLQPREFYKDKTPLALSSFRSELHSVNSTNCSAKNLKLLIYNSRKLLASYQMMLICC